MRLTLLTDYALRLLMLVALEPEGLVTIRRSGGSLPDFEKPPDESGLPLGQAEYLETVRGRNGGLRSGKAPDQIVGGGSRPYDGTASEQNFSSSWTAR